VATVGSDRTLVSFEAHHAVADGATWGIVLGEVSETYRALLAGRTPDVPPIGSSMIEWSDRRSRSYLSEETVRKRGTINNVDFQFILC
jgi:hypothetical protein